MIKDHKQWSPDTNKPVPSRPVVSGNKGVNSHLSEILEPLVLELGGGEISSTEEALNVITSVNDRIEAGEDLSTIDILPKIAEFQTDNGTESTNLCLNVTGIDNESEESMISQTLEEGDLETIGCLEDLFKEGFGMDIMSDLSNKAFGLEPTVEKVKQHLNHVDSLTRSENSLEKQTVINDLFCYPIIAYILGSYHVLPLNPDFWSI